MEPGRKGKVRKQVEKKGVAALSARALDRKVKVLRDLAKVTEKVVVPDRAVVEGQQCKSKKLRRKGGVGHARI
jgi:hypothetical protein